MSHSYRSHFFHLIWSTKNREPWLTKNLCPPLYKYIGGILRDVKINLVEIGGIENHVHLLLEVSNPENYFSMIRQVKAGSSRWINGEFPQPVRFAWQEGYGSFSVSYSQIPVLVKYIQTQEEHHRERTFEMEMEMFLSKHHIAYDKRYVFG